MEEAEDNVRESINSVRSKMQRSIPDYAKREIKIFMDDCLNVVVLLFTVFLVR
jgi:hypothetical protein